VGANLFHSLSNFLFHTGREAYFNNASNIQNIISRVTVGQSRTLMGCPSQRHCKPISAQSQRNYFWPQCLAEYRRLICGEYASSLNFVDGTQLCDCSSNYAIVERECSIGLQYGELVGSIINQSRATNISNRHWCSQGKP